MGPGCDHAEARLGGHHRVVKQNRPTAEEAKRDRCLAAPGGAIAGCRLAAFEAVAMGRVAWIQTTDRDSPRICLVSPAACEGPLGGHRDRTAPLRWWSPWLYPWSLIEQKDVGLAKGRSPSAATTVRAPVCVGRSRAPSWPGRGTTGPTPRCLLGDSTSEVLELDGKGGQNDGSVMDMG